MSAAVANTIRRLSAPELTVSHVLPAAGAAVSSSSIDLGQVTLGPASDDIEGLISLPATPSLVDAKTIILDVEDSADNSSFAAIPAVGTLTVTGASSAGAAAASQRFKFPPNTRRYVRVTATVLASGGDNTAVSFKMQLFASS